MHATRLAVALALATACVATAATVLPAASATGVRAAYLASSYAARKSPLWKAPTEIRPWDNYFTHAVAHADFDGDGLTDMFMAPGIWFNVRTPLEFWRNTGSGFENATDEVVEPGSPGMYHPRKALVGDYNADGWPDAFFLGHGYDVPPWPGEHNQLFLSNGDGTLRYDDSLKDIVGFHHGGSSADIDGNGTIDIVLMAWQGYALLNDGTGHFQKRELDLDPANFFTAELIDVDADGHIDLLAAGHEFEGAPTAIYWGDGTGAFSVADRAVLPGDEAFSIVVDIVAEDLDGDGRRDVVAVRTGEEPFYSGRNLQLLMQTGDRKFVDQTWRRIEMDTTLPWFDWVRVQDIDSDGAMDLLVDGKDHELQGRAVWRNNGRGTFYAHDGGVVPQVRRWRSWPGDFDGDGRDDILWRHTVTGESMGWPGADASQALPLPPLQMDWDVAGIGDFDGDGTDDLLARNTRTGENSAWSAVDEDAMPEVGSLGDLDWDVGGVGDFDGDGRADLLWRHAISGANMIWPAGVAGESEALPKVDIAWAVAGVGDFNGDGEDDLLWRNATTGANQIWHSAAAGDRRTVGTVKDAWWRIVHIADFDDDGADDILWRHARRGINRYWRGAYAREVQPFARVANPMQELAGVGDYDGDGRPELVWRHLETGAIQIWLKGNPKARMKVTAPADVAWRPAS